MLPNQDHFDVYGEFLDAVIISDKITGRSKGYGFVTSCRSDLIGLHPCKQSHLNYEKQDNFPAEALSLSGGSVGQQPGMKLISSSLHDIRTVDKWRAGNGNTSAVGTQVHCEMICRDSVSWNSLIAGYFENGILRIGFFVRPL
ncbi:unnamed protein product [Camellia sinensis]